MTTVTLLAKKAAQRTAAPRETCPPPPRTWPAAAHAGKLPRGRTGTTDGMATVTVGEQTTVCSTPEIAEQTLATFRRLGVCR